MSPGLILFIIFISLLVLGGAGVGIYVALQPNRTAVPISPTTPNFPNIEQARITVSPTEARLFGTSCQVSEDGNVLVVGSPAENSNRGSARIYHRSAGEWSFVTTLIGTNIGESLQGSSVAINGEGTVIAVGAPSDDSNHGAVFVYRKNEMDVWDPEEKLVGTLFGAFGSSVSLNDANGNFLIVGEPGQNRAYVYFHDGSWALQSTLEGSDVDSSSELGHSVSLDDEGLLALVGAPGDDGDVGAAVLFGRSDTTWTQRNDKIIGNEMIGMARQGTSVSLSGTDGSTIAIGGFADNDERGAVWVFSRAEEVTQQAKLVGTEFIGASQQGTSVRLSDSGRTLMIGGPGDNNDRGAYWAFTRTELLQWEEQGKFIGTDSFGSRSGTSVALSRDGTTGAMGGPDGPDGDLEGITWVFNFQLIVFS